MTETAPSFENRIVGLRIFGVLEIVLGAFAALLGGFSLLAVVIARDVPQSEAMILSTESSALSFYR